jgi:broad specificity phosphatase PhoE
MPRLSHTDWPARLWVVRHGQSAGNVARDAAESQGLHLIDLITRDADAPLSELGAEQARALGHWFAQMPEDERPCSFMVSPFLRAQQTVWAVSDAIGVERDEIHVDERLREKEFGILDGFTRAVIEHKFPELHAQRALVGKFYFRPPGGESWCDVILRLRSIVEVLRRDHVGDRVLIVAHQVIVNCMRYLLECLDEAAILALDKAADVPNCGVTEYALEGAGNGARFAQQRANFVLPMLEAGAPVTTAKDQPVGPK